MTTNGRLDTSSLATIPGGTKMGGSALIRADLLPGLVGLQAAFLARFDEPLRPTSAADGYRSYDSQVRAFLGRYAPQATGVGPFSDVRYWQGRRYVRVSGASAAVPGTSNHGWAIAVDFADVGATGGARWDWLMDAAPRFGFVNPLWARDGNPRNGSQEPWHWEGRAVPVSNYRAFLAGMGVTVPDLTRPDPLTPEDDMTPDQDRKLDELHRRVGTYVDARISHVLARQIAADAVQANLVRALANVSGGQAFDEARLLDGIRRTVADALAAGVDVNVTVGGKA